MNDIVERITEIISTEHLTSAVENISELVREESNRAYEDGYRFAKEESVRLNEIVEALS
tara:strand:+ start:839 stop:1015 length:177 start_codon:yes stop_codon:yes gene_type:complete